MATIHLDDPAGLAENHFEDAWVLVGGLGGKVLRERRSRDLVEAYNAALRLGDDLLAYDQDIAARECHIGVRQTCQQQCGKVISGLNSRYSLDGGNGDFHCRSSDKTVAARWRD